MPNLSTLSALSPLDGRYWEKVNTLTPFLSEEALIRERIAFEVQYLLFLSNNKIIPTVSKTAQASLLARVAALSENEIVHVKELEKKLNHDVKSVEYFVRDLLEQEKIPLKPYVHIGLTSDDVNETAYACLLRDARDAVMLPHLLQLIKVLTDMAEKYKGTPMLARTHGQPAVPTTVGKELVVFAMRLHRQYLALQSQVFESKLSGAVGNYNAHLIAFPKENWPALAAEFLDSLGLATNQSATQVLPAESYLEFFQHLQLVNSILIDLDQDMWRYISDEYFSLAAKDGEVGSSTMPQKVNPIDFENSEGNLGVANALLQHFCEKLPISRLQRDLSGSAVKRNFGVALGHCLLGYTSTLRGLGKVKPNVALLEAQLDAHWEIITEGLQTVLRTSGDEGAYEKFKTFARGQKLTQKDVHAYIESLDVEEILRAKLHAITPATYLGLAQQLVENAVTKIKGAA